MISSGQRFLISKSNAVFLASFLGVFVTLVSTRLWVLYSALVRWVFKRIVRSSSGTRPLRNETIPLLSRSTNAGRSHIQISEVADEVLHLEHRSHSDIGYSIRLFMNVCKLCKNFNSHRGEIALELGLALSLFALFALAMICGIFSANVVLDSVALCKSPHCGHWGPIQGFGIKTDLTSVRLNKLLQNAAAAQAAQCYRERNDRCSDLISSHLSYTRDFNVSCPLNGDVCLTDAFRMDTGYQSAMVLGVSSSERFFFRRSTTCAPISVNETYAKRSNDSTGLPTWKYYYGIDGQATFETPIRPLDPRQAGYIVG